MQLTETSRWTETARRLLPPRYRRWGKWLLYADYRLQNRELARLRSVPRYRPAVTNILGKPLDIVDSASFVFMYKEIFERQIYRFRARSQKPFIIDGGANIGLSVLYFKKLYPLSRIVAFEPAEEIFSVLEKNIRGSGCEDVELLQRALWTSETELTFMAEGADGGRVARANDPQDRVVQTVRLADYLNRPVDFLKLDIEGAETEVLKACAESLGNVEHLFVEYHSFTEEPQTLHTIICILTDAGFRLHIDAPVVSPQPFMRRDVYGGMDMQLNIFAFRV